MKYIFLFFSIVCNIVAYVLFKTISGRHYDIVWVSLFSTGLILGAVNTFLFTKALKNINLGIAYPIFSAGSIVVIVLVSAQLFNEKIKVVNIVGAAMALFGIILLTL